MATEYCWYFDDGTSVVTVTGYDNGHTQSHVFHSHGTYHVNVTVTNAAGSSQAFTDVTVVGEFSSCCRAREHFHRLHPANHRWLRFN